MKGRHSTTVPPSRLKKKIAINIVDVLVNIFNFSVYSGIYPSALKKAEVIPLFKKGDTGDVNNYRPISILSSFFSKIFEKVKRILLFLNKNCIFQ